MKESPSARSEHLDSRPGSSDAALTFGLIGAAVAYAAAHLLFLPRSLEDIDSINFALGLRHFDVARISRIRPVTRSTSCWGGWPWPWPGS